MRTTRVATWLVILTAAAANKSTHEGGIYERGQDSVRGDGGCIAG
jgi:hypothetical protein